MVEKMAKAAPPSTSTAALPVERAVDAMAELFLVTSRVIVELKSVEQLARVHKKQLLTYLRLTNCRLGLVINFGASMIVSRSRSGAESEV